MFTQLFVDINFLTQSVTFYYDLTVLLLEHASLYNVNLIRYGYQNLQSGNFTFIYALWAKLHLPPWPYYG